jgi:hypothetical protein
MRGACFDRKSQSTFPENALGLGARFSEEGEVVKIARILVTIWAPLISSSSTVTAFGKFGQLEYVF